MKEYPSIDGPSKAPRQPCYGFVKYDGSSMRAEWSKKRGWYKWGTRHCMLDQNDPIFGRAVPLFLQKYGDDLPRVFATEKLFRGVTNIIVFFEFFGEKSFSGAHYPDTDQQWDVVLFDVNPVKKGMISPKEFIDHFGHLKVAEHIYTGNMNEELIQNVRKETMPLESAYAVKTQIPEGIVCKGGSGHGLWRCKIKTERYKNALRVLYDSNWERFWGAD